MFIVSLRLVESTDTVILGIGTMPQYSQLWKDEPYPVSTFAPVYNFPQGVLGVEFMRSQETLKIIIRDIQLMA